MGRAPTSVIAGFTSSRMVRGLPAFLVVGLALVMLSAGCAQTAPKTRDLNAEAMHQMSRWGDSPGM